MGGGEGKGEGRVGQSEDNVVFDSLYKKKFKV